MSSSGRIPKKIFCGERKEKGEEMKDKRKDEKGKSGRER